MQFTEPSSKKYIDILLVIDCNQFDTSIRKAKEKKADPAAKFAMLGWTCVDQTFNSATQITNFIKTFHMRHFMREELISANKQEIQTKKTRFVSFVRNR